MATCEIAEILGHTDHPDAAHRVTLPGGGQLDVCGDCAWVYARADAIAAETPPVMSYRRKAQLLKTAHSYLTNLEGQDLTATDLRGLLYDISQLAGKMFNDAK